MERRGDLWVPRPDLVSEPVKTWAYHKCDDVKREQRLDIELRVGRLQTMETDEEYTAMLDMRAAYVTVIHGIGGPNSCLMCWDEDCGCHVPENTGYTNTSLGDGKLSSAIQEAKSWAADEGVEYKGPETVHEAEMERDRQHGNSNLGGEHGGIPADERPAGPAE